MEESWGQARLLGAVGWGSDPNLPESSMELVLAKRSGPPDPSLGASQPPSGWAALRGKVKVGPHLHVLSGVGRAVLGPTCISGALVNIQFQANTYFVFCVSQRHIFCFVCHQHKVD